MSERWQWRGGIGKLMTPDQSELSQLDVLNRSERVDLDMMLKAHTINAAWSMHQEALTGSLTLGKRADIVVLSEDLFAIPRN